MNSVSREHLHLRQALHGITLLKDSSDADRCGILCLMLKLALQSGLTVRHIPTCTPVQVADWSKVTDGISPFR